METQEALKEARRKTKSQIQFHRQNAGLSHSSLGPLRLLLLTALSKNATKDTISELSTALSASPPDLERARNLVIELNYFANIDTVCKEWQPGKRIELSH